MILGVTETLYYLELLFIEKFQLLSVFVLLHDENMKKFLHTSFFWCKLVCIFLLNAKNLLDTM